jgi:hypothetical protein
VLFRPRIKERKRIDQPKNQEKREKKEKGRKIHQSIIVALTKTHITPQGRAYRYESNGTKKGIHQCCNNNMLTKQIFLLCLDSILNFSTTLQFNLQISLTKKHGRKNQINSLILQFTPKLTLIRQYTKNRRREEKQRESI